MDPTEPDFFINSSINPMNRLPIGALTVNSQLVITSLNAGLERLFNLAPADFLGSSVEKLFKVLFTPESVGELMAQLQQLLTNQDHLLMELELSQATGQKRHLVLEASPVRGGLDTVVSLLLLIEDISGQRQIEQQLRQLEASGRTLVEQISAIIYIAALNELSNVLYISPQIEPLLGYSAAAWMADPGLWHTHLHPDDREQVLTKVARSRVNGEPFNAEYRLFTRTGRIRWFHDEGVVVKDEAGQPLFLQGIKLDITERKQAEERLIYEAHLLACMSDAIIATNERSIVTAWNRAAETLYGWAADEVLGRPIREVIRSEFTESQRAEAYRILAETGQYHIEVIQYHKNGQPIYVEGRVITLRDETGRISGYVAANRDMTEQKQAEQGRRVLERHMLEMQKIESLAKMAGGIAHDFNNLLTVIVGNSDLLQLKLPPQSTLQDLVNQIHSAAQHATELTGQMLAYSGQGHFVLQLLNLTQLLAEMRSLLQASLPKQVILQYQLEPALPVISADVAQMRQVVLNLVMNAAEALGDQADLITLTTGVREVSRAYLETTYLAPDLPEGLYVYLEVADTGSGMEAQTQARIFEPFFTTKFTGRGLGLPAVLGIVRGHKGAVKVHSVAGAGTTVTILFPRATVSTVIAEAAQTAASQPNQGVILVVDDEEGVRTLIQRALELDGFTVLTATNGQEGLELFQAHAGEIGCVLLDLTMPAMAGEQTFQALRDLQPEVQIILMSGYSEEELRNRFAGTEVAAFLHKPFSLSHLSRVVRQVFSWGSGVGG